MPPARRRSEATCPVHTIEGSVREACLHERRGEVSFVAVGIVLDNGDRDIAIAVPVKLAPLMYPGAKIKLDVHVLEER